MMKSKNRFSLGFFPTPLTELNNLTKIYPSYRLFIKRDDHTGLASGGNKTRKLEYLIQEALEQGCNTVITAGAQQSNHCRQTAAACAIANLKCHLLLGGEKPEDYNGNLLLSELLGANIHFTGENRKGEDVERIYSELRLEGAKPYIIPYGGSNLTGALGYVNAVKELKEQLTDRKYKIDYIFFASSSGGMQAGLTLGKMLYKLEAELIPINIDKNETGGHTLEEVVLAIINTGKEILQINESWELKDIPLIREYDKAGYGIVSCNETDAINLLAKAEGILLDPVYTARAFYGMMDYLEKRMLPEGSNVLFWHTGGFPAIFYYSDKLN
jgi:D-cysteine desulfhydrase family pyridoxal phosphate-dependent enzyme